MSISYCDKCGGFREFFRDSEDCIDCRIRKHVRLCWVRIAMLVGGAVLYLSLAGCSQSEPRPVPMPAVEDCDCDDQAELWVEATCWTCNGVGFNTRVELGPLTLLCLTCDGTGKVLEYKAEVAE